MLARSVIPAGCLIFFLAAPTPAAAELDCRKDPLIEIRLEEPAGVTGITRGGSRVTLLEEGRYRQPRLAADGCTFGVLEVADLVVELPGQPRDVIPVVEELQIRRMGRRVRSIRPGLFIRAWTFWDQDRAAAISHGPRMGAATYELIALADGETIEVFMEGERAGERPAWVLALDALTLVPEAAAGHPAGAE